VCTLATSWLRPPGLRARSGDKPVASSRCQQLPNQLVGDYTNPILNRRRRSGEGTRRLSLEGVGYPTPATNVGPTGCPTSSAIWNADAAGAGQGTILYLQDHHSARCAEPASPAHVTPSWYAISVGHYEGNTLVIDTVGIKIGRFSMVDMYGTPYSTSLHVWSVTNADFEAAKDNARSGCKNKSRYPPGVPIRSTSIPIIAASICSFQLTVEDAGVFTTPWSAYVRMDARSANGRRMSVPRTCVNTIPKRNRRSDGRQA